MKGEGLGSLLKPAKLQLLYVLLTFVVFFRLEVLNFLAFFAPLPKSDKNNIKNLPLFDLKV